MKKLFFLFLTCTTTMPSSQDNHLIRALLNNDAERLTTLITENPERPIQQRFIEEAIEKKCYKTLAVLAELVNDIPPLLNQYGFRQHLGVLQKTQSKTLLMVAAQSRSKEMLRILLTIPSIKATLNYSYTINILHETEFHSAFHRALQTNSDMIEILLDHGVQLPKPEELSKQKQRLLAHAQNNIVQKNAVCRYHLCLQKSNPSIKIPVDLLAIISSYLVNRKNYSDFWLPEDRILEQRSDEDYRNYLARAGWCNGLLF